MTFPQKGRIFISYRRADSAGYAGRIYDRFVAHFGEDTIFMDVDTIEGGLDFVKVLEDAIQSCDLVIALIGRQWLNIKDKSGKRRLDNPEDFVRIEIATALKRNIRVIPVLVDGVSMPPSTELPENLKALARRNALQVNHHSFNPDVYRLIEHSESALNEAEESRILRAKAVEKAAREKEKQEANKAKLNKPEREKEKENLQFFQKLDAFLRRKIQYWAPFFLIIAFAFFVSVTAPSWFSTVKSLFESAPPQTEEIIPTSTSAIVVEPSVTPTPPKTARPENTSTKILTPSPTLLPEGITYFDPAGNFIPMRLVPEGEFTMGSEQSDDEKPIHQVTLDAFYMDKYETTNALYRACVDAGACTEPHSTSRYTNNDYVNHPVVYVDWYQAQTYCEWRGADLPSEAQWEKAARGTDERTYPWGEDSDCDRANSNLSCVGDTTEVGSYESGKSPYDIYDMYGNVWEWVNNWYSAYPGNTIVNSDYGEIYRVMRGGSWSSFGGILSVYTFSRWEVSGDTADDSLGFRCLFSPP